MLCHNLPERQTDSYDSTSEFDHFPLPLVEEDRYIRSRSQLSEEQRMHPKFYIFLKKLSVKRIWHRVLSVFTLKILIGNGALPEVPVVDE